MLDCSDIVKRCETRADARSGGNTPPSAGKPAGAPPAAMGRAAAARAARRRERKLRRDLRALVTFVRIYCAGKHKAARRHAGGDRRRTARVPLLSSSDLCDGAGLTERRDAGVTADKTAFLLRRVFAEVGHGGRVPDLCGDCARLLAHALVMRVRCPLDPKPTCKHCPEHCYAPRYRAQIREVMRYSGPRLVLRGRLDYLWHLVR